MVQLSDIFKMFDSERERETERESAIPARRSNQLCKGSSSCSSKNYYSSCYSEKSRSIKPREIEEKKKLAELQAKIREDCFCFCCELSIGIAVRKNQKQPFKGVPPKCVS